MSFIEFRHVQGHKETESLFLGILKIMIATKKDKLKNMNQSREIIMNVLKIVLF